MGILDLYSELINHPLFTVRLEVSWALSNMVANNDQINDIIMSHNIFN